MTRQHITPRGSGIELLRRASEDGLRIISAAQARDYASDLSLSESYIPELLHQLERSGWLRRIHGGLYSMRDAMLPGSPLHEYEIGMALVSPAAISHWTAMHHHGFTEQIPEVIYVLTTSRWVPRRRSGSGRAHNNDGYLVNGIRYQFVQVKPDRYFGTQKIWIGTAAVQITDPERTLIDGLVRPQYCGGFGEVLTVVEQHHSELDVARLISYAKRVDEATVRRLGWILEHVNVTSPALNKLASSAHTGFRPLDPTSPARGHCNRRWGVQENLVQLHG